MLKNRFRVHGVSNSLWNSDIAQTQPDDRSWGIRTFCWLWVAMSVGVPTYLLASGLILLGMSGRQALGTILLGNLIVLFPTLLTAHVGARYGIPFAVLARASFGVMGARVPAILRAIVASGWFGIQCWIGGLAVFGLVRTLAPGWMNTIAVWHCFALFWLLKVVVSVRGFEGRKEWKAFATILLLLVGGLLLVWWGMRAKAPGSYFDLEFPALRGPVFTYRELFVPALTACIGFWSLQTLSAPDWARRARSQGEQIAGQTLGLMVGSTLYSLLAILVTAAVLSLTTAHRMVWNPVDLVAGFHHPALAALCLVAIAVATFSADVTGSLASAANDLCGLRPGLISQRVGALMIAVMGVLWLPWRLLADPGHYIYGWLIGSSGLMAPVAGVMIVDYFLVRRRLLDVEGLYVRSGSYEYRSGFNGKALVALAAGMALALVGAIVPQLHWLYDCAWFVGFDVAALVYLALMSGPMEAARIPPAPLLIPMQGFEGEGA